jgi:hypothetical protein
MRATITPKPIIFISASLHLPAELFLKTSLVQLILMASVIYAINGQDG